MSQSFPVYSFPDISTDTSTSGISPDPVQRIGIFGDILEGTRTEGLVSYAPETKEQAEDSRSHHIRHRTIATRLWLLGYLPEKPKKTASHQELFTDRLKQAMIRFQQEARLNDDGWAGDETWYALDELVSFESETASERWFPDGESKPLKALERAVHLRLFSMGLAESKPETDFESFPAEALARFKRINIMFKLTGSYLPKGLSHKTVNALFNLDLIIRKLSESGKGRILRGPAFTYTRQKNWNRKETRNLARRFIINIAKIELWLIGFEVDINGKDDFKINPSFFAGNNQQLQSALFDYWRQLWEIKKRKSRKLSRSVTPEFFNSLQEVHEKSLRAKGFSVDDDYSKEVADHLKTDSEIENAWGVVKQKSVSLWDGLKRLWRWIKRKITKIISFLKKNVFRAFFRYATKAYKIVKTAVQAVISTVNTVTRQLLPGSNPDQVVIFHDIDFDQTVFINRSAAPEQIEAMNRKLKLQTAMFRLGTRIISLVFDVFKGVVTGLIGWAKVLSTLVRSLKELKPLYRQIKELKGSPA